jgi:uncharacterized protein YycO
VGALVSLNPPAKGQIGLIGDPQTPVARLITKVTRSTVFHVVICVSDTMIVSADPDGVHIVPIDSYPTAVWSNYPQTPEQSEEVADYAIRQVGLPYNWVNDLFVGLQYLNVTVPGLLYRASEDRHEWMCSQLGYASLQAGGVACLTTKKRVGTPSPGDFEADFRLFGWFPAPQPAQETPVSTS